MNETINIYCDESCHLEHDGQKAMVLGAIWCPLERTHEIAARIREIKSNHGLPRDFEVKWTKVSAAKQGFYIDLVRYFFEEEELHFRALVVPDKSKLRHEDFDQDHDTWYYKMYFDMLKVIFAPRKKYRIYLDIKDTCGAQKSRTLHEVIASSQYDFQKDFIERLQVIRSHEVEQLQLADLLLGAVSYANRGLAGNAAKVALVEEMRRLSGYNLTLSTFIAESKVNILVWRARGNDV